MIIARIRAPSSKVIEDELLLRLQICILGAEPLSPKSDARAKGLHYTVKERRYGYECLLCGLLGDIGYIRSSPCKLKDDFVPADEHAKALEIQRKHQEDNDRKMAKELQELWEEETRLEQMLILQQLQHEEMVLEGLLNEQRALNLAERLAEKVASSKAADPNPQVAATNKPVDQPPLEPTPDPTATSVEPPALPIPSEPSTFADGGGAAANSR